MVQHPMRIRVVIASLTRGFTDTNDAPCSKRLPSLRVPTQLRLMGLVARCQNQGRDKDGGEPTSAVSVNGMINF